MHTKKRQPYCAPRTVCHDKQCGVVVVMLCSGGNDDEGGRRRMKEVK